MTVQRRMSDVDQEQKRPLTLRSGGTLGLNRPAESSGQVKQSFSHGRSKTVAVEVRPKRRLIMPGSAPEAPKAETASGPAAARAPSTMPPAAPASPPADTGEPRRVVTIPRALTADERAGRLRAVKDAARAD